MFPSPLDSSQVKTGSAGSGAGRWERVMLLVAAQSTMADRSAKLGVSSVCLSLMPVTGQVL